MYNPKYAVFGYVRSSHLNLFKESLYSLHQNVPLRVTSLCIKYYNPKEYFDTIYHDDIKVSKDKKTIYKHHQRLNIYSINYSFSPFGLDNTSFGRISIPSTSKIVCEWYWYF